MKIGDVSPLPLDCNLAMAKAAMARRRVTQRLDTIKTTNQAIGAAKKAVRDAKAHQQAQKTPLERAKTFLRTKGYRPVATLEGVHFVGTARYAKAADVIEFAKARGWGG